MVLRTLIQDNKKMATNFASLASQRYKRMDYRYDLVSGNVHRMSVQSGSADQWHHAYLYDADNRITAAYTNSQTPIMPLARLSSALQNELVYNADWEEDAAYYYYDHGPLARTEIGEDQLQGFDYLYNLQGWMKGINAISAENDPGKDGIQPSSGSNPNQYFGKDLAAFSLSYFNNDYTPINGQAPIASVNSFSHPASNSAELFNGNIRYMQTRLTNPTTGAAMSMLNAYQYDQLNRLKASRSYESGFSSNVWNPTTYNNSYFNAFSYDAMGNILTQERHKRDGTKIEDMSYQYQYANGQLQRNRLYHINDAVASTADLTDIDDMGTFNSTVSSINTNNNYSYDEEGRLTKDVQEEISKIVWRVDGKVKEIQRGTDTSKRYIRFDYDAMGHRIAKHVYDNTGVTLKKSTYYILDAQGNQVSMYEHLASAQTAKYLLVERNMFGSSRLGTKDDHLNMLTATVTPYSYTRLLGTKKYEFTNHLGNVLTIFCDVKVPLDNNSDGVVDSYRVCLQNTYDYSPFGVSLDGRTLESVFYRRGFGGHEKVDEYCGEGNQVEMKGRWLDSRLGRTSSMDPKSGKYPYISPYTFAVNNPLAFIDPDGKDVYLVIWFSKKDETGHAAIAVDNYKEIQREIKDASTGEITVVKEMVKDGTVTYYDLWPKKQVKIKELQKDVTPDYNKRVLPLSDLTTTDPSASSEHGNVSEFGEAKVPDGVVKISTGANDEESFVKDGLVKGYLESVQSKNSGYNACYNNCSNFAESGIKVLDPLFDASQEVKLSGLLSKMYKDATITAPNNLYNAATSRPDASVISGPSSTEAKPYLEYFEK